MTLLGIVLVFATDLHHLAIGAIAGSYHMLPRAGDADLRHVAAGGSSDLPVPSPWVFNWRRRSWCSARGLCRARRGWPS